MNFGSSCTTYFPRRNDSLQAKIGIKTDEISQKYQNPNNVFIVFFSKIDNFLFDFTQ